MKSAKNSAEQAKAAAEQASLAKDHFLAILSHELRHAADAGGNGSVDAQDRPDWTRACAEMLEMVRRNVEMEARLIDDLLTCRVSPGERSN